MTRIQILLPLFLGHPFVGAFIVPALRSYCGTTTTSISGTLTKVPEEDATIPIPFMDTTTGDSFIECYPDAVVDLDGVAYTIGVPCDHSVALCYFDEGGQLIPLELDDTLMDDVYPMAESIVADEFGEELVLQRTPQTLTLVGELESEEEEDDYDDNDDEESEDDAEQEEVEVLLSFQHRNYEFNLVKILDPVLLVGKSVPDEPGKRFLLTPQESIRIMPDLEILFLDFHDENGNPLPSTNL